MKQTLIITSLLMSVACSHIPGSDADSQGLKDFDVGESVQGNVYEHMLANGMKVLVKVDRRAPVAVNQVWYKVGSSCEHNGITGVSHVLEHMMFKGTDKLKPGQFSEIVAQNGGRDNAFTGKDYTAYFQTVAADRLFLMMALEADRMRNIRVTQEEFAKELEVVKEERMWRTEDNPHSLTYERFQATAFMNSPYRYPVIGWMEDLNSLTREDIIDWYQRWYAPNKAILVVVGDVDPAEVFLKAQETFGLHPAVALEPPSAQPETPQLGERRIQVHGRSELPYLLMGWKVPSLAGSEGEAYALEVLAGILAGGNSARFPRQLVREQKIAQSAGARYNPFDRLTTLFSLSGTPAHGKTTRQLEAAFMQQIQKIKTEPVSEAELDRVKSQVLASSVYEKDSMFYQGMVLGMLETNGLNWQKADEYVARIQAVTALQIKQVANKYFTSRGLSVAELVPEVADMSAARGRQ